MACSAASDLGLHCLPMSLLWDARLKWVKHMLWYSKEAHMFSWGSRKTIWKLFLMRKATYLELRGHTANDPHKDLYLQISHSFANQKVLIFYPVPAEPGPALPLQTVKVRMGWLLQKPTDLVQHFLAWSMALSLALSMWLCSNALDQVIRLTEN